MSLKRKDLLGIKDLEVEEINLILSTAESFKEVGGREIKKVPTLRGRTVVNLFFEPSTRTRASFELAAKRLSADVINISAGSSSAVKGETLVDTAKNLEAMGVDLIVVRHGSSGAPALLARALRCSVINAGDGAHEHPTQALLDLLTVRQEKGRIDGLTVAIVGDILHSRVARSNIYGFRKLGAEVRVAAPPPMLPAAPRAEAIPELSPASTAARACKESCRSTACTGCRSRTCSISWAITPASSSARSVCASRPRKMTMRPPGTAKALAMALSTTSTCKR